MSGERPESPRERFARAMAVQAQVIERFRLAGKGARLAADPLCPDLFADDLEGLRALPLHGRRYGMTHAAHAAVVRMGCRDMAAVATCGYGRCVDWLGYREADALRLRARAVLAEVRAGVPEPGVTRMATGLDDALRGWLRSLPVEALAGSGVSARAVGSLRGAGYGTVLDVAVAEADAIRDVRGIGPATVVAARRRLDIIRAEAGPTVGRLRAASEADAEWDAAAPGGTASRRPGTRTSRDRPTVGTAPGRSGKACNSRA